MAVEVSHPEGCVKITNPDTGATISKCGKEANSGKYSTSFWEHSDGTEDRRLRKAWEEREGRGRDEEEAEELMEKEWQ